MGGVTNPTAAASYTTIAGAGAQLQVMGQFGSGSPVVYGLTQGGICNLVNGSADSGAVFFSDPITGSITRSWLRDSGAGDMTYSTIGSTRPFSVGGGGAPAGPNIGGFVCEIYAGIGDAYHTASNPGYFIGLASQSGAVAAGQLSTHIPDAMGIILDSTAATLVTTWQWITRRAAGAAAINALTTPANAAHFGQLFALLFSCPPNSDAISLTVKELTAAGVWTTVLAKTNLTGIGAAMGTRLAPLIMGRDFVNSGQNNDVMLHRVIGSADIFTVPHAFP